MCCLYKMLSFRISLSCFIVKFAITLFFLPAISVAQINEVEKLKALNYCEDCNILLGDISSLDIENMQLDGVRFFLTDIQKTTFKNSSFTDVSFLGSNLKNFEFISPSGGQDSIYVSNSDLSSAIVDGIDKITIRNSNLTSAKITNVSDVIFYRYFVPKKLLVRPFCEKTDKHQFYCDTVVDANAGKEYKKTSLKNADFSNSHISGDLSYLDFSTAKLKNTKFSDNIIFCQTKFAWGVENPECTKEENKEELDLILRRWAFIKTNKDLKIEEIWRKIYEETVSLKDIIESLYYRPNLEEIVPKYLEVFNNEIAAIREKINIEKEIAEKKIKEIAKSEKLASDIFDYIASFSKEEFMPVDAGSEMATRNPEEQYRYALSRALQNQLVLAENEYEKFLKTYPNHSRYADSLFWIGRMQTIQDKFENSISSNALFLQKFENDPRIKDIILSLMDSAEGFGTREFQCVISSILERKYPREFLTEPLKERISELASKNQCDYSNILRPDAFVIVKDELNYRSFGDENPSNKDQTLNFSETSNKYLSEPLNPSELKKLRNHISQCWSPPIGAIGQSNLRVDIWLELEPDGAIKQAKIQDKRRFNQDKTYKVTAEAALRAVVGCGKLPLPPEKYEYWKTFIFSFEP